MEFFSKPRVAIVLGIAAGFPLNPEHLIYANCTSSIITYEKAI